MLFLTNGGTENYNVKKVKGERYYGKITYADGLVELNDGNHIPTFRKMCAYKHECLHALFGPLKYSHITHPEIVSLATFLATIPRLVNVNFPVYIDEIDTGYNINKRGTGLKMSNKQDLATALITLYLQYHKIKVPQNQVQAVIKLGLQNKISNFKIGRD